MGTPPAELPGQPPQTQVVGQQSSPSTVVPTGGGQGPGSTMVAGRRVNTLAVVCLVTSLTPPFGHVPGVVGIALLLTPIVPGHMARAEIRRTGEDGATVALIGAGHVAGDDRRKEQGDSEYARDMAERGDQRGHQ